MRARALLALLVVAAAVACGGASPAPSPTPPTPTAASPPSALATPTPTPTPTPPPVDITIAHRLERNGQYEEASAAYEAIVSGGAGDLRQQARLGLARLYLQRGRYDEARRHLAAHLREGPPAPDLPRAYFLLAQVDAAQGRPLEAAVSLQRYVELGGAAAPYARLALARGLRAAGLPALAVAQLQQALAEGLAPAARARAILSLAEAHQEAGDAAAALAQYSLLQGEARDDGTKALALWRTAAIHRRLGDPQAWREALTLLVWRYPEQAAASEALAELAAASVAVDPFAAGMVHYRQQQNGQALAAFQRYLEEEPEGIYAGAAHFYAAATHERLGDYASALGEYALSAAASPAGSLADDALWWRGRLLEDLGRYNEADAAYDRLGRDYPFSRWADEAAFRRGFARYQQGDLATAVATWSALTATFNPRQAARAHLWLGKVVRQAGDEEGARSHWRWASALAPADFSGLRAEALLAGVEGSASPPTPPPGDQGRDVGPALEWLSTRFGPESLETSAALFADRRWQAGLELAALGLGREAVEEMRDLIDDRSTNPWALYRLAVALGEEGLTPLSAATASRLAAAASDAPQAILRLAYPEDYADLVGAAARDNGLPPLLLQALIRQESFYDPSAVSPANAMGLTQVIPSTGREIAQGLGYLDFAPQALLRPVVSIPFGAFYLGQQLRLFDGNVYHALAAYNGGPGNALRWSRDPDGVGDVDFFVETIDLEETRLYVQLVLEHYAVYRYAYGAAPHPSLVGGTAP